MPDTSSLFTRRALLATVVGGATIATALAQPRVRRSLGTGATFKSAFTSASFSLVRSDHDAWAAQIGSVLQVRGGPSMRIEGIELFADYGRHRANLIRGRAFLVRFELLNGGRLAGDAIYTVSHASQGAFDLYLLTTPTRPSFVQAVFN